ncbi:MAG: FecR domain-containing protein [Treponema sp.]|nr:FecR domain-containing protein [Treponema sp.]
MKRVISKLFVMLLLAGMFCSSVFAASAKVTYVKGKVEVSRGNAWVAIKVGDEIKESETISTGFQSEARLNYNGSVMAVPALSRVTLETLQTSSTKDTVSIKVDTGAVRSKVTHTDGKRIEYSARTSVAVASVRGTDFSVFCNGRARVFEGAIAYFRAAKFNAAKIAKAKADKKEGDQGAADATTPAGDISDSSPDGAVVVGAGQSSKMNKRGRSTNPFDEAKNRNRKARNALASASEKDANGAGGFKSGGAANQTGDIELSIVVVD